MPWSGNDFTRLRSWVSDAANGIDIEADLHDEEDDNFREGIETALRKDGGNTVTANLNIGGFRLTNVATPTASTDAVNKSYADGLGTPVGAIVAYGGSSAPTGWAICNGQAVSRTTYATLFALYGTRYGVGDGSTTFNLPDITGRVIAGKEATQVRLTAAGSGVDGSTLGATGGDEMLQEHAHQYRRYNQLTTTQDGSGDTNMWQSTFDLDTGTAGTGASENVQPTIVLNWIVRLI